MAKKHHTKDKGDIGFLKAISEMSVQGYTVLVPMTEHATYDCVIEKNNIFKRVQCKYRSVNKFGSINIRFRSTWSDKNGTHINYLDKNLVDLYAVYCPEVDKVIFFDPKRFNKVATFRVENPKNNQHKGVNFVNDYFLVP